MSKRDIPEINAGSMADIAFLLLIFFLVTTTMDKDQAYIRSIPKKIEVKQDPVKVEERCIMAIKANNKNQLMVRNQIVADPDKISEKIVEFYRKNEKQNDVSNNFPMYSRISLKKLDENIRIALQEAEAAENNDMGDEIIEFKFAQLATWEQKKSALILYGGAELPEIDPTANIRIEVQTATDYSLFAKIHTEIEEALYELRDDEAQRLFNESYGVIKKRFNQDENNEDKQKLGLLDVLYPARIIEVTPKN